MVLGVRAWGIGREDRALSYLSDHVCCHHLPLQFVVHFVFDVLSFLCFWEWVIVMLAVISKLPHDHVLITETRQIVWVCLPVSATLYFYDPCLSPHFCLIDRKCDGNTQQSDWLKAIRKHEPFSRIYATHTGAGPGESHR